MRAGLAELSLVACLQLLIKLLLVHLDLGVLVPSFEGEARGAAPELVV